MSMVKITFGPGADGDTVDGVVGHGHGHAQASFYLGTIPYRGSNQESKMKRGTAV